MNKLKCLLVFGSIHQTRVFVCFRIHETRVFASVPIHQTRVFVSVRIHQTRVSVSFSHFHSSLTFAGTLRVESRKGLLLGRLKPYHTFQIGGKLLTVTDTKQSLVVQSNILMHWQNKLEYLSKIKFHRIKDVFVRFKVLWYLGNQPYLLALH